MLMRGRTARKVGRFVKRGLLATAVLFLNSCGLEEERAPEPAPVVSSSAKPNVVGVKLTLKAYTTSKSLPGNEPVRVADGDLSTGWSAGEFPPQWIQVDLGEKTSISNLLLNIDQYPDGPTTHEVYGGPTPETTKLIGTLNGDTKATQWLELKAATTDVRFLKIVTTKSPSWVGWHEIEVYQ